MKEGQTVRDIAAEHLGDPNKWPEILKANDMIFPHEVQPGMTIKVPSGEIAQAERKIAEAKALISEASKNGAGLFSPDLISKANELRNGALQKQKAGQYSQALNLAAESVFNARKALEVSKKKQDQPGEAVVDNFTGQVHRRQPSGQAWEDVKEKALLQEGERVRTLSDSSLNLMFRDQSRLHLKENSQALIRKMRTNLLDNTEEADVSLIEGDVLALLQEGQQSGKFKLDVEGVETKGNSSKFFVGKSKKEARFVNYDGELEVSSGGGKVILGENQGSVVKGDGKPTAAKRILGPPSPSKPQNGVELFNRTFKLEWKGIKGADYYLVEFASDGSFQDIAFSQKASGASLAYPKQLDYGLYYWRVVAVDSEGLPGQYSPVNYFRVTKMDRPPYLMVSAPSDGVYVTEGQTLKVTGSTEEGATVKVQGTQVKTDGEGNFSFEYTVKKGDPGLEVKAENMSGKPTIISKAFNMISGEDLKVTWDSAIPRKPSGEFVSSEPGFTLRGTTMPGARVTLSGGGGEQTGMADASGSFRVTLDLRQEVTEYTAEVATPSGAGVQEKVTVEMDRTPPAIKPSSGIPSATMEKKVKIHGKVEDGATFSINGEEVPLGSDTFEKTFELKDGKNTFRLSARDLAGNLTVKELSVIHDSSPPEFVSWSSSPVKVKGGEQFTLAVKAKDLTELVKTAPVTVKVGEEIIEDVLVITQSGNEYSGTLAAPSGGGRVSLESVELSDYLGNKKEYRP